MILYINGNEHCAAAGAVVDVIYAEDDVDLWWMGETAHPLNLQASFGTYISKVLKARYINQAHAKHTNDSIITATKYFIEHNPVNEEIVAIIGFPVTDVEQFKEFGQYLKSQNIKHILYPHEDYVDWLTKNKFKCNENGYFGGDAHRAWAGHLIKPLTRIL